MLSCGLTGNVRPYDCICCWGKANRRQVWALPAFAFVTVSLSLLQTDVRRFMDWLFGRTTKLPQ